MQKQYSNYSTVPYAWQATGASGELEPRCTRLVMTATLHAQQFQQEVFNQMMEKMKAGEEGYDPMSLYQPLMENGMNAMSEFQRVMMSMMSSAGQASE